MAPYIPEARRRPWLLAAGAGCRLPPAAIPTMIAPSDDERRAWPFSPEARRLVRFMFRVITPPGVTYRSHPRVTMWAMDTFLHPGDLPGRPGREALVTLPSRALL
jgi:hypothetical protein